MATDTKSAKKSKVAKTVEFVLRVITAVVPILSMFASSKKKSSRT